MRFRREMVFGLVLSAMLVESSVAQPTPATTDPSLTNALGAIAQKHNLRRLWFHLEQGGKVLANLGVRGADANAPEPVGSLTKSITGIAIALLIQQQKLSLNSTVGDLLGSMYARNHRLMDANLKSVTVERLLTHTAGLRPNKVADPVNGVTTASILQKLHGHPSALDFLYVSDGDHSTGESTFVYSNFSYLMLGLIIEAVSGETYDHFCRDHIFKPLGINPSVLGGRYTAIAAYSSWVLNRHDMAAIWLHVFDRQHPSILTTATLDQTLFAPLGKPTGSRGDARYVMGVNVKRNADQSAYRLFHNGEQATRYAERGDFGTYYSYMEDTNSDRIWIYTVSPTLPTDEWRALSDEFRDVADKLVRPDGLSMAAGASLEAQGSPGIASTAAPSPVPTTGPGSPKVVAGEEWMPVEAINAAIRNPSDFDHMSRTATIVSGLDDRYGQVAGAGKLKMTECLVLKMPSGMLFTASGAPGSHPGDLRSVCLVPAADIEMQLERYRSDRKVVQPSAVPPG